MKKILFLLILMIFSVKPVLAVDTITVNPNTTYQTFTGWEETVYIGDPSATALWPAFNNYKGPLLDKIVNDYGLNRIRLEITPGTENSHDYYSDFMNGQISQWTYVHCYARSPINDDSDPNHINSAGFQFSALDWRIDNIAIPLRALLQAKGEKLHISLHFVSFGEDPNCGNIPSYPHTWRQYDYPQEYAELMLATFQHFQNKYGFVPDSIDVMNEPDLTTFNATKMGNAIKATQTLLASNGFNPKYVIPSVTNMANTLGYFNTIKSIVGDAFIRQWVLEIAYHRYGGVSDANSLAIANASVSENIGTSMLEWWSSSNTYQTLYKDLTMGRNTAWQEGTILGIYNVDATNPNNPIITISNKSKFIRQYTKFIREGAVRIDAQSTNSNLTPLAFINKDGKYVVVVGANNSSSFSTSGLPAGTYGIKYTTGDGTNVIEYDKDLPDQTITNGNLTTSIPAQGVITIYGKTSSTINKVTIQNLRQLLGVFISIFDYNRLVKAFGK